ncbi:hypothetical protein GCM10010466_28300 [Planomonospora alba]|uniref:AMIN-like domain-containing protein n=1 Tax=Planomonospora alba TaxID=161354 RepID=A0ABP6N4G4_9ACTN
MNSSRAVLAAIPLVLLLAGCGGAATEAEPSGPPGSAAASGAGGSPGAAADPSGAPAGTPDATRPGRPPAQGTPGQQDPTSPTGLKAPTGTEPVEVKRNPDEPPLVTGVRFAEHPGFDRVVIDFAGTLPGYTVDWVPALVQDGSGDPIDVEGGAYLQVTLTPANAHTEAGEPTLKGGPVFQAGLGNVRSVVKTGDFEAVVGVGVVLERKAAFRVIEQKRPDRLVVDVAH